MEIQRDYRRGHKTRLRLNAPRKKNKTIKGRKLQIVGNKNVYLKEDDPRINLSHILYADVECNADPSCSTATVSEKKPLESTPKVYTQLQPMLMDEYVCPVTVTKRTREPDGTVLLPSSMHEDNEDKVAAIDSSSKTHSSTPKHTQNTDSRSSGETQNKVQLDLLHEPADVEMLCPETYSVDMKENHSLKRFTGRRIFDVSHMFAQIKKLSDHSAVFGCSFVNMELESEEIKGMESTFHFVCNMCGFKDKLTSDNQDKQKDNIDITTSCVNAMLMTGQGYAQLQEITSTLDMPCMSKETFNRHQKKLSSVIHDVAWERMLSAGKEEAELAIAAGDVDSDGVPCITVVADGAWCKRTFKTNYNALSGVACIMGVRTKKVLYMSVRNKYCCICARSNSRNETPKDHLCFRNWNKTSSAMEADIIVEGFQNSVSMHNLKYKCLIGDGDSSVTRLLAKAKPYGQDFSIQKIECSNHILRNYLRRIREIVLKTKNSIGPVPLSARTALSSRILRLRTAVTEAVKYRASQTELPLHERIEELRKDIDNGPYHVFGYHSKCNDRNYFCNGPKQEENNLVPDLQSVGIWDDILAAKNIVAYHANSLIHNVNTNMVEGFNSVLCKHVGGKRVNFALRGSYQTRTELSVISHNTCGKSQRFIHKKMTGSSPGKFTKQREHRKESSTKKRRSRKQINEKPRRRKLEFSGPDIHYGKVPSGIPVPDIDEVLFEKKKEDFLAKLALNTAEIQKLEKSTKSQRNSPLWIVERSKRITASNFGKICRLRASTPRAKTVACLLYNEFSGCAATNYGIANEPLAITQLEMLLEKKIEPAGLLVDPDLPWLAATPDGLIGSDAIVEVKCPVTARNLTPQEAVEEKKVTYCTLKDNQLQLKEHHPYMYQVQGQLHISQRQYCYFVVWTPKGISVQKIHKDDTFWEKHMKEKLTDFFMECLLPEVIDPRYSRGMAIREPPQKVTETAK